MEKRELPEGWEWKKIGDEAELIMGQSPPGSSYNENGDGIPFLQGNAEFGDFFPTHKKFTSQPSKIARRGSILISVRAPVGDLNIANFDYCIGRGLASISLKNGENKYLFYLLKSLKPLIESKGTGSTFKAISKVIINEIEIPLPPLPVQRRIVEILEQADALRYLRAQADAETQKLLQSVFYEMFGDPVRNEKKYPIMPLKKLCLNITDGKHGDCKNLENSGYFFISAKDIVDGKIDYSNSRQITKEDYFEVNKRVKFEIGDILITNSGSIGKIAIADDILKTSHTTFQKSVAIIKIDKNLTKSKYLVSFLEFNKNKLLNQSSGSSQKNLLLRDINNFKINLPPLDLQQRYTTVVNKFDIIREIQKVSEKEINLLIDCLMAKAFAGELN